MSFVTVTIGGHTVSNDVIDVDIWMNKKTSVGVCELFIDNDSDQWGDDFEPNDAINLSINGTLMFVGLVDNVIPSLDKTGVKKNFIKVRGRDAGRYLIDYYYTEDHGYARSGAIIDDILAGVGDPLSYTDPGGTPFVTYNSQRSKLVDSFKDISDLSGYDYYIDTTGTLQFFDAGTVSSGVALKNVSGASDNNLLDFEEFEEIGYDIKNYIEIHGGSVKDHWTEGNSADWTDLLGGGTTFADETTVTIFGASSIKVIAADGDETFGLDFSGGLYSQGTTVDMSSFAQNKVLFRHDDASTGDFTLRPYLKDSSGNEIIFTRNESGKGSKGFTENISTVVDQWRTLSYQTGEHTDNTVLAVQTSGRWSGDTAFDWGAIEDIGFQLITTAGMDTLYVEGWYMPAIEAKSISEDSGVGSSQALYGKRMYSEFRKDLKSQNALDDESAKILDYRKDPLQKFKATARGQVGTKYAAQTVTVQAPDYGLPGATTYVIQTIHHILHNDTNTRGWDFLTKYELALSDVDSTRVIAEDNPLEAQLLKLARENRGFKGAQTDDEYYLGDIITGINSQLTYGTSFPTDANQWDRFYRTDLDKEYYYDGASWVLVELDATVVTGEIDPDQMAIEVRPWTANFSIIWDDADDEPPTDWNHFKWGLKGSENTTDATIAYADGTSVDVNFGQNTGLGDGAWWVYWDEAQKTGGDYDVQFTQTYNNATGSGKGVLAQVFVNNASSEAPDILLYNTYTPTIGTGSLVAHAIQSKHISADFITGKNFRTAANVGVGGGPAGITFTSSGILGYSGGTTQTFELDSSSGNIISYGDGSGGSFRLNVGANNYGWLDCFDTAGDETVELRGDDQVWFNVDGDLIKIIGGGGTGTEIEITTGGTIEFSDNFTFMKPSTDGGVNIGSSGFRFGLHLEGRSSDLTANAANEGRIYVLRTGAGTSSVIKAVVLNSSNAYELLTIATST